MPEDLYIILIYISDQSSPQYISPSFPSRTTQFRSYFDPRATTENLSFGECLSPCRSFQSHFLQLRAENKANTCLSLVNTVPRHSEGPFLSKPASVPVIYNPYIYRVKTTNPSVLFNYISQFFLGTFYESSFLVRLYIPSNI
jgi:hypothetical protein